MIQNISFMFLPEPGWYGGNVIVTADDETVDLHVLDMERAHSSFKRCLKELDDVEGWDGTAASKPCVTIQGYRGVYGVTMKLSNGPNLAWIEILGVEGECLLKGHVDAEVLRRAFEEALK